MKKYITLFVFLFLFSFSGFAQKTFAPAGAEWYYDLIDGVAHAHLVADTFIQGRACKHLKTETGVRSPLVFLGFTYLSLPDNFFYNGGDTTFVYNNSFKRFTPLYIWNVNAHDTVVIPAIQGPFNSAIDTTTANSHLRFVVDSVKMVTYDTSSLKTVYVTTMPFPGGYNIKRQITYAEKLGSLTEDPWCGNCVIAIDDRIPSIGSPRCYHDSSYAIKLAPGDCSKGIVVEVNDVPKENTVFNLFPNPANNKLTISGSLTDGKTYIVTITDLTGRMVCSNAATPINGSLHLSLGTMAAGVYMLKMWNETQYIGLQKLAVQ